MTIPQIDPNGRVQFQELYYITHIDNVDSILQNGILSNKRAQNINHQDIANNEVQARRDQKNVPNDVRDNLGKRNITLHQYANLYMRAHNAMLYVRRGQADNLCVLRIDSSVLNRRGVVLSNRNASTDAAQFFSPGDPVFDPQSAILMGGAHSYINDAHIEQRKQVRQAEVEVPKQIHPSYIRGAYVANVAAQANFVNRFPQGVPIPVDVHQTLFFQNPNGDHVGMFRLVQRNPIPPMNNINHPQIDITSPESSAELE